MEGIDSDPQRLLDITGRAAPLPDAVRKSREPHPAVPIPPVAGGAVVDEQRGSGLPHRMHEARVFDYGVDRLRCDPGKPEAMGIVGGTDGFQDLGPLVVAKNSPGVRSDKGPGGHENPVGDGEGNGCRKKKPDRPWHRRIQLLNTVPFVAGGWPARVRVAFA